MQRYFDSKIQQQVRFLKASEIAISHKEVLATLLGSCISVVLYDFKRGRIGINHFVNPYWDKSTKDSSLKFRYGDSSIEGLIELMEQKGSLLKDLKARVVGGAHMSKSLESLAQENPVQKNIDVAFNTLLHKKIPIIGSHIGGKKARWIYVFPQTGRTLIVLKNADSTQEEYYDI